MHEPLELFMPFATSVLAIQGAKRSKTGSLKKNKESGRSMPVTFDKGAKNRLSSALTGTWNKGYCPPYNHHVAQGRPARLPSASCSLDGLMAIRTGSSR